MYENLVVWIAYDLIIGDKNPRYKNVPKLEKGERLRQILL